MFYDKIHPTNAEVAELADALRSGRSGRTLVRVQIPPSALIFKALERHPGIDAGVFLF
jgi:hypothetical protein